MLCAARCCPSSRASTRCSSGSASALRSATTTISSSSSGPRRTAARPPNEIRLRFADATQGVPKETRQALVGGYTTFERILPGPDRMYPDTDSPPTRVTAERVARLRAPAAAAAVGARSSATAAWRVPAGDHATSSSAAAAPRSSTRWSRRPASTGWSPPSRSASGPRRCSAPAFPIERLGAGRVGRRSSTCSPTAASRARPSAPWPRAMAQEPGARRRAAAAAAARHRAAWPREHWRARARRPAAATAIRGEPAATARERRLRFLAGEAVRACCAAGPRRKDVAEYIARRELEEVRAMTIPISERTDRFQGYRGPARDVLDRFGIGVWSEVEIDNDAAPSSTASSCRAARPATTCTSSSSSSTATTSASPPTASPRPARSATARPSTRSRRRTFPFDPTQEERHAAGHRRHHRLAGSTTAPAR